MNLRFFLIFTIIFSLFMETTLFTFPFVYIFTLVLYIIYPDMRSIIFAFIAGLVLDSLKLTAPGVTSLVILLSFAAIEIIKRFAELKDYKIVLLLLFASSYIYASSFSYSASLLVFAGIFSTTAVMLYYLNKRSLWRR